MSQYQGFLEKSSTKGEAVFVTRSREAVGYPIAARVVFAMKIRAAANLLTRKINSVTLLGGKSPNGSLAF
jgi:hypothetical protein